MLYRKIKDKITEYLKSGTDKVLIVEGARQIGKTFIIRVAGRELFDNFIELNLLRDYEGEKLFEKVRTTEDFYFQLSMLAGDKMKERDNTLIFLDEIQAYPHLLTMLKFLREDNRYTYICSGSLLGITLSQSSSIPMGSIDIMQMYPLDFEEFLLSQGFNSYSIDSIRNKFEAKESLDENTHNKLLNLFKKYLLIGGLPEAINVYNADNNIVNVRRIQNEIHEFYKADASKYDDEHKLKIRRIYDEIPSYMQNKKKRIVIKNIENKGWKRSSDYADEFDYLINAGIALEVKAISNPVFPLIESSGKNLLKLYLNDAGILSGILYRNNVRAVMDDLNSVNLGSLYETAVATELKAHGYNLYYYDNRSKGEVDFLIDDYDNLCSLPIEVKSGKDYIEHSALNNFLNNPDYNVKRAFVFSNEREVKIKNSITYLPVYYIMFFNQE